MNNQTGEKHTGRKIAAALLWLLLWQLASMAFGKSFVLPSPVFTCRTLLQLCTQALFWRSCAVTLLRTAGGMALAALLGFLCAWAAWKSGWVREILAVPSAVIKSVPVMSVILIALLCLKSHIVPVFVCFLMCFPVMYTNILHCRAAVLHPHPGAGEQRLHPGRPAPLLRTVLEEHGGGGGPQQPAGLHGLSSAHRQDVPGRTFPFCLDGGHRAAFHAVRKGGKSLSGEGCG